MDTVIVHVVIAPRVPGFDKGLHVRPWLCNIGGDSFALWLSASSVGIRSWDTPQCSLVYYRYFQYWCTVPWMRITPVVWSNLTVKFQCWLSVIRNIAQLGLWSKKVRGRGFFMCCNRGIDVIISGLEFWVGNLGIFYHHYNLCCSSASTWSSIVFHVYVSNSATHESSHVSVSLQPTCLAGLWRKRTQWTVSGTME